MKLFLNRTPYYWVLEVLTISGLIYACYPLLFYGNLSENAKIPIHFNALGEVDGWGGRAFLFFLPLLSLAFYVGFCILERYPQFVNYPFCTKSIEKNTLNKIGANIIRHIKSFAIIMFAFLSNRSFNIATGKDTNFGIVVFLLLCVLVLTITFFSIKLYRLKRNS